MNGDCVSVATSNVVVPRRPATAMDHVIKENVVQPPVIRPKPLPVTGAAGVSDQVYSTSNKLGYVQVHSVCDHFGGLF